MRIVVDTNVLISGLRSNSGPPATIVDAVAAGKVEMLLSNHLREEFSRILDELQLAQVSKREVVELRTISALLDAMQTLDVPAAGFVRDRDDRHVLGAALHLSADVIVSGDKDLLVLESFEGIPILSPRQLLDHLDKLAASAP